MSDSYSNPQQQEKRFDNSREGTRRGYRPNKGPGNKEFGGFRIRLSDNEMRSARALQEAFNLRSTVAVLGFAIRTLAQMLEEGKIDDLISLHRSQATNSGNRRDNSGKYGSRKNTLNDNSEKSRNKPNPFARPEKPQSNAPSESTLEHDNPIVPEDNEIKNLPENNKETEIIQSETTQDENESKDSAASIES